MAGKISLPLCRAVTWLPSTMGGPRRWPMLLANCPSVTPKRGAIRCSILASPEERLRRTRLTRTVTADDSRIASVRFMAAPPDVRGVQEPCRGMPLALPRPVLKDRRSSPWDREANVTIWPGEPYPLGATWDGAGTNFSLFSEPAERVELCLYDDAGD